MQDDLQFLVCAWLQKTLSGKKYHKRYDKMDFCVDSTDKLVTQFRLSRFHFENVRPVDLGMLCYCEVNCLFVSFLPRKPMGRIILILRFNLTIGVCYKNKYLSIWKISDNNQDTENYQIRRRLRPYQFESQSDLLI